jgi:hypothetical protein
VLDSSFIAPESTSPTSAVSLAPRKTEPTPA